jgi:hypothetical protein
MQVQFAAPGALGTLAIALILAFAMFNPLGSWVVSEAGARTNLGWMILGGIILSYFVGESLHLSDKKFAS